MYHAGLPPPRRPIAAKTACRDDRSTSVRLSAVNQEANAERSICRLANAVPHESLCSQAGTSCRVLRCTYHFTLDCIVERNPGLPQLGSKCRAKLLLEAPDQRVAKRDKVRWINAETCMLA